MDKKDIDKLNSIMLEIEKIGKCPHCYFENRKHKIKLLPSFWNVSHTFECNKCGGIHDTDSVVECVDMDIRKYKTSHRRSKKVN